MKRKLFLIVTLTITIFVACQILPTWTQWVVVKAQTSSPKPNDEIDAKSLIIASSEACLKVKTIEYEFEQINIKGEEPGFILPTIKATMRQERAEVTRAGLAGKYQATGTITLDSNAPKALRLNIGLKDGEQSANFALAYNGEMFQILSVKDQQVLMFKPPQPQAIIKLRDGAGLSTLGFSHFTDPAPFKRILETNSDFTYLGITEIDRVKCHTIKTTRILESPNNPEIKVTIHSRIYIGEDDLLPHRIITGTVQSTVHIKKINQSFVPDDFTVPIPNGYSLRLATPEDVLKLQSIGLLTSGTLAPEWKLFDAEGKEHKLSDYRGKVVVMDFWATWCGPCVASMPTMQALHEKYAKKGVVVIGISNREEEGTDSLGFMKKKGLNYQLLIKGDSIVSAYKAEALPTFYIIGKEGQIIYAKRGYNKLETDDLEKVIDQYLKDGTFQQTFVRGN